MHTNDNGLVWNEQIATRLRSIAFRGQEELSHQSVDYLKKFDMIWCKMAEIIDFKFMDNSAAESISQCYNANKGNIFSIFNNADDASEFFSIFRSVKAWLAFYELKQLIPDQLVGIQDFISFLVELVEDHPTVFHKEPPLLLEAILVCSRNAVKDKRVSYEVLEKFHKIIQELEANLYNYAGILEASVKGNNRAEGKQERVQRRLNFFKEFDDFYTQKHAADPKITKHQAARMFFVKKTKDEKNEEFATLWRNAETFYKSYCNRKQSSSKNRKREEEKTERWAPYAPPQVAIDELNNWLSDPVQFSTE